MPICLTGVMLKIQPACRFILLPLCPHRSSAATSRLASTANERKARWYSTEADTASGGSSVDSDEIAKFDRAAHNWWDGTYGGENAALHTMNALRVPLIRDALVLQRAVMQKEPIPSGDVTLPLSGMKILDVGCGGGILSEPLARLGAEVTGLDASAELLRIAVWHASRDPAVQARVMYKRSSIEEFCHETGEKEHFDGVVASEIIEHVARTREFVSSCCSLVKPGGSIFFTTVNKNWLSYATAIFGAERLVGIVPRGTHDWHKFISPQDLEHLLVQNKFSTRLVHGMALNPLTLHWCWVRCTAVNYAIHAVKSTDVRQQTTSEETDAK